MTSTEAQAKDSLPRVAHILPHSSEFAHVDFFRQEKTVEDFDREIIAQDAGFIHVFARATAEAGFEPTVYYFSERGRSILSLRHKFGHRLVRVPVTFIKGKIGWEYSLPLFRILHRDRPDLAHIHGTNYNSRVPCMYDLLAFYCRWRKIPFVGHYHGATIRDSQKGIRRAIKRRALESADRIVTCNQIEVARLCDPASPDYYGFDGIEPQRVQKLHNVTDAAIFQPADRCECRVHLGLDPDVTYLLSVGRLTELKRFEDIIELLLRLPRNTSLIIAGDGEHRPVLELKIQELGLDKRVILAGTVKNTDLHYYYNAADVFLLASRTEGLPIVIQEALSCRLPVIATELEGTHELLAGGIGLMFPVGDIGALQRAVEAVLSGQAQPDWEEAERRLRAHSFEAAVAHLERLYTAVLTERKRPIR